MPSADGDGRSPSTRSSIAARPPVLPPLDLAVDQDNEQELLALPEPSNNVGLAYQSRLGFGRTSGAIFLVMLNRGLAHSSAELSVRA